MIQITDSNYEKIIKGYIAKGNIVVAMSGTKTCDNCIKSQQIIGDYQNTVDASKVSFVYMNNSFDFALESMYQMEELNEYPKTVIYTTWLKKDFVEGVITLDKIKEIEALIIN